MSEWSFMSPQSKDTLLRVIRDEAEQMFALVDAPGAWESPTGAGHWQVRDVVGHLVDTTEEYFVSFEAARGTGEAVGPLGLTDMARHVDEGAQRFRSTGKDEMLARLRKDFEKMQGLLAELTDDEWGGFTPPHKFMGPVPAFFYAIFQLVDYGIHNWDIREGTGRAHALAGDTADLLAPVGAVLWQATAQVPPDEEPYSIGVRITSGHNAGDTRFDVGPDGVAFAPGSVDGLPAVLEFDPATLILNSYGRMNGGTVRGDTALAQRFLNLCFRI